MPAVVSPAKQIGPLSIGCRVNHFVARSVLGEGGAAVVYEAVLARGRLGLARARAVLRDLLLAVEAVHRAGVVHRDIKPSHVIIQFDSDNQPNVRKGAEASHTTQPPSLTGRDVSPSPYAD